MAGTPPHESSHVSPGASPRRVFRSRTDRMIFGVCGGIGRYFDIDATLVRVIWVLAVFIGGSGILAYLISAALIPNEPASGTEATRQQKSDSSRLGALAGAVLILFGVIILFNSTHWTEFRQVLPFYNFWHFQFSVFGPIILITLGALLVLMYFKKELIDKPFIYRSKRDKKIFGVCGGIGAYFKIDPTIVRIFWIFFTVATGLFTGVLIYVIFTVLLSEESSRTGTADGTGMPMTPPPPASPPFTE